MEEYYPNALTDTYKGVSGYIYSVESVSDSGFQVQIPDAATSNVPVKITACEYVPDAYEAILSAEKEGLIVIRRYEDNSEEQLDWIKRTVKEEFKNAADHPEYQHFLVGKFSEYLS